MNQKIVILGLDGATWIQLDNSIDQGLMPNLEQIIKKGTRGILESNFPFTSGSAWTSILTGTNPGKHGIPHHIIGGKREVPIIWEYITRNNLKSIVVNEVVTYPPEKINGIMVSGGHSTPSTSNHYTFPEKIISEITELFPDYCPSIGRNSIEKAQNGNYEEFYNDIENYAENVAKLSIHFAKKYEWNVFAAIIESTDYLHHYFWDKPEFLNRFYSKLDGIIKDIFSLVENSNGYFLMISDHGFGPIKKHFLVNTWLQQMGFSDFGDPGRVRKYLSKTKFKRNFVRKSLSKLHLRGIASKVTPTELKQMIPIEKNEHGFIHKQTRIFSEAYNEITVNIDDSEIYEDVRNKVIEKLRELKDDEGNNVIQDVRKREEVFNGSFSHRAYDIQFLANPGFCWSPSIREKYILNTKEFVTSRSGDHRPEGIFFAYGPDVEKTKILKNNVKMWDFCPTILHILDCKIPKIFDGNVIKEIFNQNSKLYTKDSIEANENEKDYLRAKIGQKKDLLRL